MEFSPTLARFPLRHPGAEPTIHDRRGIVDYRPQGTTSRSNESYVPRKDRWIEEIGAIRDRVTISSWGIAGTATRYATYDRNGNINWMDASPVPIEPPVSGPAIRRHVTLEMEPSTRMVREAVGTRPARVLVWSPAKALPEPA